MNFLLIWDIDGTLIQGRGMGRRAMDEAFFDVYGIRNGFKGINMAGRLDSIILQEAFTLHGLEGEEPSRFFNRYCGILEVKTGNLTSSLASPGIPVLLEKLREKDGFYHVLGTGNIERAARIKLSADNMNRFFPTGGFGDERIERWQVIQKAVINSRKLFNKDFADKNIYVIGDTPKDIECGVKLGTKTIGVATGTHTLEQLQECRADYLFENLADTAAFLDIFPMESKPSFSL